MKLLLVALALVASVLSTPIDLDSRIIGGNPVTIEQFPWMVSVQIRNSHGCGGSIIRANRVLTAAHCMFLTAPNYQIRAGSTLSQSGGQLIAVSRFINHPQYNPNARPTDFDVSVLWLASSLNLAPAGVSIIPLPPQSAGVPTGALSMVAGWGHMAMGSGVNSPNLRAVSVPIVANAQCTAMKRVPISASMLCAGFPEGGRDACQNDSGGPLTLNGQLIGVVSWGIGCALPNNPGVYARVAFFRNWIDSNV